MNATQKRLLVGAAIVAAAATALHAQNREWTTANGDAQRNSWVRTRSPVDEGCGPEGRVQVPLEDEAERREPPAQFADAADPARSADLAPRLQGAGVRRHEQRADLRHRHGSQPGLLGARDQLLVDRAARQQLVGVPGRADVGVHAADARRASGVRRRPAAVAAPGARSASRAAARRACSRRSQAAAAATIRRLPRQAARTPRPPLRRRKVAARRHPAMAAGQPRTSSCWPATASSAR